MFYIFKKRFILIILVFFFFFYLGYKSGIYFRYQVQKKMLPEYILDKYSTIYDHDKHSSIYWETFKRYLITTKEEINRYQMETLFNLETKPFIKWFINHEKTDSSILDVGGATGLQWKIFKDKVILKNLRIFLVEIDKNCLRVGKQKNKFANLTFYHLDELDKIKNEKIDTILMCEVYMQIPKAPQVLKDYIDRYPNARAIIIHSVFKDTFSTKILNFFKKYFFKHLPLVDCVHGRAMTDKILYSEIAKVGLKVLEEHNITHLSKHKRPFNGQVKAYVVGRYN